jgi:hypothetical protein
MNLRSLRTAAAAILIAAGSGFVASCSSATAITTPGTAGTSGTSAASGAPTASGTPDASGTPGASITPAASPAAPGSQVTGTLANGTTWVAEYPQSWNGTLILYSHGFGALTAEDAPDSETQSVLLGEGYALAGSSYDPNGSEWALDTAVSDQFNALAAVESTVLPRLPEHVLAFGTSMGGLVSALEAQDGQGKIDGALTTCGVVSGGVNLDQYQLDGEYAIAQLLGTPDTSLVGLDDDTAESTSATLTADATQAQATAAGQARLALAMAFLNMPPWGPDDSAPAPASDPAAQEAAQADALLSGSYNGIYFMEGGRLAIEQADGGQAAGDAGTNFAQLFAGSPYAGEVKALYQAAGLNLQADLATLTAHAAIKAAPAALKTLETTSVPTGRLAVPELDLHTTGDNLVPVQSENYYAKLVANAGSAALLRQAYTESQGHCNFSVSEQVAGLQAVLQRVTTGQWGNVATAASLETAATALNIDAAHFTDYSPGDLTGAVAGS